MSFDKNNIWDNNSEELKRLHLDRDNTLLISYVFKRIVFPGYTIRHIYHFIRDENFYENILEIVLKKFGKYFDSFNIEEYQKMPIRKFIYDYLEKDPLIANAFVYFYISEYIQMYSKYNIEDKGYEYYVKNISDEDILLSPHIYNISLLDYRFLNHVLFSRALLTSGFLNTIKKVDPYILSYIYRNLGRQIFNRMTEEDIWILDKEIGFIRTLFFSIHIAAAIRDYRSRVNYSL